LASEVEITRGIWHPPGSSKVMEAVLLEGAVGEAIDLLRRAKIRGNRVVHRGETVTSESLKRFIDVRLLERGCLGKDTIVAPGDQGCDPHNQGSGPILPHRLYWPGPRFA